MELLQNFVSSQHAPEQEVNGSITTIVDRLSHSTLISDRRSAILSLKSFSRQYRELVVSKGLKYLVANLQRDSMDDEAVKATLETLLILFIRGEGDQDLTRNWITEQSRLQSGKYPSPSLLGNDVKTDQFSLWIADELTQSKVNIQLLVDFLDSDDMHIRIYSLQLMEALCATRPARTKELILEVPTAVSKLCSSLDEAYEPIRNEAVLLLMNISRDNFSIQKLVVFENTFDKLYAIIKEEGGIVGNVVVQDCLMLINNLLAFNSVNQKYFLETSCMPKLADLINQPLTSPPVWNSQRLRNIISALTTCSLFVPEGTEGIANMQATLLSSRIMLSALQLAFSLGMPNEVRVQALRTVADIIRGNSENQRQFSMIDVPYLDPSLSGPGQKYGTAYPVLYALLQWCLCINSVHLFDLRMASYRVLQAYLLNNDEGKMSFIEHQANEFKKINHFTETSDKDKEEKESKPHPEFNVFQSLVFVDKESQLNPYKIWFSVNILMSACFKFDKGKKYSMGITIGNADADEDVINMIDALAQATCLSLNFSDPRIATAYLMILLMWIWEDYEADNLFLSDPSCMDQMLSYLADNAQSSLMVGGLLASLMGVVYEFSLEKSPISRAKLHDILESRIGSNAFSLKVQQFMGLPQVSNFEKFSYTTKRDETGLPEVFFTPSFINFLKDNYSRVRSSFGRDPKIIPERKLDYDSYSKLQDKLSDTIQSYDALKDESTKTDKNQKSQIKELEEVKTDTTKKLEDARASLGKLQKIKEELDSRIKKSDSEILELTTKQKSQEAQVKKLTEKLDRLTEQLNKAHAENKELKEKLSSITELKTKAENGINKMNRVLMDFTKEKDTESRKMKSLLEEKDNLTIEIKRLKKATNKKDQRIAELEKQSDDRETSRNSIQAEYDTLRKTLSQNKEALKQSQERSNELLEKIRRAASIIEGLKKEKDKASEDMEELGRRNEATVAPLREQITTLRKDNNKLTKENQTLSEKTSSLEDELTSAFDEFSTLQEQSAHDMKDMKSQLAKCNEQLKSAEAARDESITKLKDLQASYKLLEDEKEKLETTQTENSKEITSGYEKSINELTEKKDEAEKALNNEKRLLKNALTKLKDESKKLKTTEDNIDRLEKAVDEKSKEIEKLKSEVEDGKKKSEEAEKGNKLIEDKEEEIKSLQTKLDAATEKDQELAAKLVNLKKDQKKKVDELNAKINSVHSESMSKVNSLTSEHKDRVSELNETVKSESNKVTEKTKELDALQKKYDALKKLSDTLIKKKASDKTSKMEITKLESDLKEKEGEIANLKTANEASKGVINKQKEEIKAHKEESQKLEEANDEKGKKLEKTNTENAKIQHELEATKKENESLRSKNVHTDKILKSSLGKIKKLSEKEKEVTKLQAENETLKQETAARKKLEEKIKVMESKRSELELKDKEAESTSDKKIKEITKTLELRNQQLSDMTDSKKNVEERLAELEEKYSALEKKQDKAKGENSDEDFQQMLLLLDNLDSKNKKLKARLIKLGEEVSEDEEEDDSDDDGDDDDSEEEGDEEA